MVNRCVLFLMLLALSACWEATADDDDVARNKANVANLPPGVEQALRVWAANRTAYGWMLAKGVNKDKIGEIDCRNAEGLNGGGKFSVFGWEVLECLNNNQTHSYEACIRRILRDFEDRSNTGPCTINMFKGFRPNEMPAAFDPSNQTFDTMVQVVLGEPPPKEIQLLLIGAGWLGPAGVLCPLDASWDACSEDPVDVPNGPGSTGAGAGPGGDYP